MANIKNITPNNEESWMEIQVSASGILYRQEFGESYAIALTSVIAGSTIYDKTAEPGVYYQYSVGSAPNANDSKYILRSDDIYLMTRDKTMRIRYNPTLTSYKRNFAESVTPTLGGIYPITRRNGAQNYRTFQVGGLLSYNIDAEDLTFISNSEIKKLAQSLSEGYERNRYLEKLFRKDALEFLNKNQILLFKSYAEGNAFIKLSNIQLTSDPKLDRNVYSFSATATEVLPTNEANYRKYFFDTVVGTPVDVTTYSITDTSTDSDVTVSQNTANTLEIQAHTEQY